MHEATVMGNNSLRGRYSPMETAIFRALRSRGPATAADLIRNVYPRKTEEPYNAQIVVNRAVITLADKLKRNRESFRLKRKRLPRLRLIENTLVRR